MTLSSDITISKRLRVKLDLACNPCTWWVALVLLVAGVLTMTVAALLLGYIAVEAWHGGWVARTIAFILFASAPFATFTALIDYRESRNLDSQKKRLAWLGVRLAILGGLELALVFAEIIALNLLFAPGLY